MYGLILEPYHFVSDEVHFTENNERYVEFVLCGKYELVNKDESHMMRNICNITILTLLYVSPVNNINTPPIETKD